MWEFRWYEPGDGGGERPRRTMIVGTANKYPSESAARKAPIVQAVLFRINCNGSRFYPSLLRVFLELSPPWTGAFLEHSRRVI